MGGSTFLTFDGCVHHRRNAKGRDALRKIEKQKHCNTSVKDGFHLKVTATDDMIIPVQYAVKSTVVNI